MLTESVKRSNQITKQVIYPLFFLAFFFICGPANSSDLEKEKRWSAQISDSLVVGDAIQLKAGGQEFLGIFTEAVDGPTGKAVIIMHGIGAHPDWPEIVNPLRSELPEHGWTSLSIQMPVLENDAPLKDYAPLFDEVAPRIDAAVQYLAARGDKTIVLIGHSLGASMGAQYLASSKQKTLKGFVAIGMSVVRIEDKMNSALALEKINLPVLDLYGSRDLESILDSVRLRKSSARKAGNHDYRQQKIEGADHFFTGLETTLTRIIYGWLKNHFGSKR